MILPIYAYGQPVLRKVAADIDQDHEGLADLIENMWETMYNAKGVGLAAPQIGKSIRLFVVDTKQIEEDNNIQGIKQVFINAKKIAEAGPYWEYEEGCLSIPNIRGDVERQPLLRLEYYDENFEKHLVDFDKLNARVIQHEYDHLEGILFTEKLKPLKRRRIQRKLENIKRGRADADYTLRFAR